MILFIGMQQSGKSTMARNIAYRQLQPVLLYDNPGDSTFSAFPVLRSMDQYQRIQWIDPGNLSRWKSAFVTYVPNNPQSPVIQGRLQEAGSKPVIINVFQDERPTPTDPAAGRYCLKNFRASKAQVSYADFLDYVKNKVKNAAIMVTDATPHERNQVTREMRAIMYELTHYALDLFWLFHNSIRIPLEMIEFSHYLIKFREENAKLPERFYDRLDPRIIANLEQVWESVERRKIQRPEDRFYHEVIKIRSTKDDFR